MVSDVVFERITIEFDDGCWAYLEFTDADGEEGYSVKFEPDTDEMELIDDLLRHLTNEIQKAQAA